MLSKIDLTQGGITGTLLRFTLPMIIGSLLQQCYNIADTLIVGQCIGSGALAAVGSAYTLMVFLISILLGLSMGSGTVFSLQYGAGRTDSLRRSIYVSVLLIGTVTLILNIAVFVWIHPILRILQIPKDIYGMMYDYLWIIFWGIGFTFIYNFYAALLRAIGDAVTPLWFLAVSVVLNIELDLFFILQLDWGIKGAAIATVAAQGVSALGIMGYAYVKYPELRLHRNDLHFDRHCLKEITSFSALTCVQQSVMNLGILMVQGLVNSFGTVVMAAFAAAIKIDSFAYMPVQEFGNAFSTFIAQNFGARKEERIRKGVKSALITTVLFSLVISILVFLKIYYLTNSGRRAQINATTGSYQFDAFYSRHSQQTQQYPKDRCGRRSEQTTGSSKRRKEKDSFQFHFCMLMLPFKRMRVYDNHPIYHMRVSKKGNTSQIGNKYQWKEKL